MSHQERTISFTQAMAVGIDAIVGGGILVLAGVAFAATGPAAILAFGLNGLLALITALSFAELATSFPESGGPYTFSKKLLSVKAAFSVGWILWFAYIAAGVLYALGFGSYLVAATVRVMGQLSLSPPDFLQNPRTPCLVAVFPVAYYGLRLIRKTGQSRHIGSVAKLIVFAILILAGIVAVIRQPIQETKIALSPLLPGGLTGLMAAMGFTFIAMQGFDLIAALAGEIRDPRRVIPSAMTGSLLLALLVYLPLLFVAAAAGGSGQPIGEVALRHPDTVIAIAAQAFMGGAGFWLVAVAALLSTLAALRANLLAASHVALAMARDRTLPPVLATRHRRHKTPAMAIYVSGLCMACMLLMVPNLAVAGSAASLIFLLSFALTHLMAYLLRKRGGVSDDSFEAPFFPVVPLLGGAGCLAILLYQAVHVPLAGGVIVVWLGIGVALYMAAFQGRAETADAAAESYYPSLVRLRGRRPLVLVPIANPESAGPLIAVANAIAPAKVGRVLLLTVVRKEANASDEALWAGLSDAQRVIRRALVRSFATDHTPEALITIAKAPWPEIQRIARIHDCDSLVLGISAIDEAGEDTKLHALMNQVDCHVAVLRAPPDFRLQQVRRLLVPVGGRGVQHEPRARLLGSLCREATRDVTILRLLPQAATEKQVREAHLGAVRMAEDQVRGKAEVRVERSSDIPGTILSASRNHDLMVLGLRHQGARRRGFGDMTLRLARESPSAVVMLSRGS